MTLNAVSFSKSSETVAEAVGRLLLIGFESSSWAEAAELIKRFRPAGLIFFKRNYPAEGGPAALRKFIERAQALAESHLGRRLFMAIDHEGGPVQRLPEPYTILPAASSLALEGGPERAEALAFEAGRQLAATGFNFNLAPVLDLATSPDLFMAQRSFGADPERVAAFGQACLRGYHQAGVIGAGKHFPGLGSARLDPHLHLPVIGLGEAEIRLREIKPFAALLSSGELAAVMSTHALYPALDPLRPATFSPRVVGLLKEELGFKGALLTDDLEMGGALAGRSIERAVVEALCAGHDLALICRRADYLGLAAEALAQAVKSGEIGAERLADAHARTQRLLDKIDGLKSSPKRLQSWFRQALA